jgi:hypothetical protein
MNSGTGALASPKEALKEGHSLEEMHSPSPRTFMRNGQGSCPNCDTYFFLLGSSFGFT